MRPAHASSLAGIGFAVLATACFATLDTTTKSISAGTSLLVALWFRYSFQAVVTQPTVVSARAGTAGNASSRAQSRAGRR